MNATAPVLDIRNLSKRFGEFTALDNLCTVGSTFTSITGTLAYSFSNFKLEPRDAADIVGASCQPYP